MPIRVRLTAAFAVAMAIVLAGFGAFAYARLGKQLDESLDVSLRARADELAALVERSGGASGVSVPVAADPEESVSQVLTPDGAVVAGSVREPVLTPAEARRAAGSPATFEREVPPVEGTARLVARPAGGRVVVVGQSLDDRDETLGALLASLAIGGPIAVAVAAGFGYLLAAAALAPVERMRRRAEDVSLERPGERLPLPQARDEIERLGRTLNRMLERLEQSFERERRFVADASHELRTPLAVLKTELEAALRGDDPDARGESLTAAAAEVDQLAQLADDLLLIARSADGQMPLRPERIEVPEALEHARERFVDRARQAGREIAVAAPDGLAVEADPLRLRQALGNLVDNALRHGAGTVRVAARAQDGRVVIEVADEGPGFEAEFAPRAFERFARGDDARTRGGAGLGLAIVSAIAEAHGGTAAIARDAGAGALVRVDFPRA